MNLIHLQRLMANELYEDQLQQHLIIMDNHPCKLFEHPIHNQDVLLLIDIEQEDQQMMLMVEEEVDEIYFLIIELEFE